MSGYDGTFNLHLCVNRIIRIFNLNKALIFVSEQGYSGFSTTDVDKGKERSFFVSFEVFFIVYMVENRGSYYFLSLSRFLEIVIQNYLIVGK